MSLLKQYLGLCHFKNNPLDLVPPKSFMINNVIFYLISGIIVEGLIADFADGTLEVSLRAIMAFSSTAVFLFVRKRIYLFQQLFTAVFVCENFIMTLAILAEVLDFVLVINHFEYNQLIDLSFFKFELSIDHEIIGIFSALFLVSWYLSLVAYILRKMFSFQIGASLGLAFSYFVLTYGLPMFFMDV